MCEIGLKANKAQIIHNFARFVVHEFIVSGFGLRADTSSFDGVLCNSRKTPLLKHWITGKKSLHVSCDRVQNVRRLRSE